VLNGSERNAFVQPKNIDGAQSIVGLEGQGNKKVQKVTYRGRSV